MVLQAVPKRLTLLLLSLLLLLLPQVMLANSVVIKEDSDWIEYYYRCG
jgi:hypothetical protein